MKLNIGGGKKTINGYKTIDRANGQEAFPLPNKDNSVDEIYASHVLEHFPHGQLLPVLQDWVRTLKPGGRVRLAVPNLRWIAQQQLTLDKYDGKAGMLAAFLMGGQTDANDFHHSTFTPEQMTALMETAGLESVRPFTAEYDDCSKLPVSLNMCGWKPDPYIAKRMDAVLCMTVPRLGFMDNMFRAAQVAGRLAMPLDKCTGAFWCQGLTKVIQKRIDAGAGIIVTLDYDTVFEPQDVVALLRILEQNPEVDAVCACQFKREADSMLLCCLDDAGEVRTNLTIADFRTPDTTPISYGHFGLTAIRADKLRELPHPWMHGHPNDEGRWEDGRVDPDIAFWQAWAAAGNSLHSANWVKVGHMELQVTWPSPTFERMTQSIGDYEANGKPMGARI